MGAVIGIDLGTTNTVIAAVRDGRPTALPDEFGSTMIPSIVSFLPSGAVLVGSTARERRSQDVRNTVYSVKRLIGRTWDSPEVSQTLSRFPFELREGPGRTTYVIARGETYTLPEISAFVLRKAKSIAELELGETVDRAVITVPASFNELQRAATKVAGRVAGLEILRIINEPTAAALAFGHSHGDATRLAVYDFGGGTFDFTLLRLTNDVFEVLATAGDTFLGGDDIDAEIVERMADRFIAEDRSDPREVPEGLERLRDAAEQLKQRLSSEPDASVRLDELGIEGAPAVEFLLTRRDLDAISRPVVERTFAICRDALAAAKLNAKDLDDVLLVGGSTKDPYVRKRVAEFFGRPPRFDVDPHEVVALGAAQYAAALTNVGVATSEISVPPPPLPLPVTPRAHTDSYSDAADFRQKTQPFGRLSAARPSDGPAAMQSPVVPITVPPVAAPNELGLGFSNEPLSRAAPSTQDFGARKTTGIGIGPVQPPPLTRKPSQTLPLIGPDPSSPVTRPGPEATLPLPELTAARTAPTREPPRGPIVRVAAGVPPVRKSAPDLSQTLASPRAPMDGPKASPAPSGHQGPPTDRFGFSSGRSAADGLPALPLPLVSSNRPAIPTEAPERGGGSDRDSWTDLPERTASPKTRKAPEKPVARNLPAGAPDLPLITATGASLSVAREPAMGDEDAALPANAPSARAPARNESPDAAPLPDVPRRQASLNEAEIRARYGNLPLIVGGKRVGPSAQPSEAAPSERQTGPSGTPLPVPAPTSSVPVPAAAAAARAPVDTGKGKAHPAQLAPPLSRLPTQVSAALPPTPVQAPPQHPLSLEPEPLEFEEFEPRSSRPAPSRALSARPLARQDLELEAELPIPEVPPSPNRASLAPAAPPLAPQVAAPVVAPMAPPLAAPIAASPRGPRTTTGALAESVPHLATQNAPPPLKRGATGPSQPVPQASPWMPTGAPYGRTQPITTAQPPTTASTEHSFAREGVAAGAAAGVAVGAAASVAAGALLGSSAPKRTGSPALLIDVTPLSLCVETAGGYADVLVSRNTPVPCERTRDFVTAQDNQQTVVVRVAQGESAIFHDNVLLGEVELTGLTDAPRASSRISVTFGLDSDGMLHVRALDVTTGRNAVATIQLVGAPSSPEMQQMMTRHLAKGDSAGLL